MVEIIKVDFSKREIATRQAGSNAITRPRRSRSQPQSYGLEPPYHRHLVQNYFLEGFKSLILRAGVDDPILKLSGRNCRGFTKEQWFMFLDHKVRNAKKYDEENN